MSYLFFALLGYLSGSILYSSLIPAHFRQVDIRSISDDGNPGAGNVFKNLGVSLGMLCLICDVLKGTVPVALSLCYLDWENPLFALVLASPVLGHAKKGKAIAVSFGVLLGLLPFSIMVCYLILPFLGFSGIIRVNPHAWRVILSFLCFAAASWARVSVFSLRLGALLISLTVTAKHLSYIRQAHERPRISYGLGISGSRK